MSLAQASAPSAHQARRDEAAVTGINLSLNCDLSRCLGGAQDDKRLLFRMTSEESLSQRCSSQVMRD